MRLVTACLAGAGCALAILPFVGPFRPASSALVRLATASVPFSHATGVSETQAAQNLARPTVTPAEAKQARSQVGWIKTRESRSRRLHRFTFPEGERVEFTDRPKRPREGARRKRVVVFSGMETAAAEPEQTFLEAAQRTALHGEAARALRFVSQHEGGFDAVNTWDRARFSWGFIQFAGGRGLPPMLAHFKSQSPELFHRLLGQYGVDVLPGRDGDPVPVCVDSGRKRVLYGARAEQRIGDDPLLIGLFIRAGRDPEVQRLQIEAACNLYVRPALNARSSGVVLSSVLRSTKGLAMLIDRKIHEGNCMRLARAMERVQLGSGFWDPSYAEGQVLLRALQDTARPMVRERLHNIYYSDLPGPV